MNSLNIGSDDVPKAQSNSTFTVTHRTKEQMEEIIRENYAILDSMEAGVNLGVFPFGYDHFPINTIR